MHMTILQINMRKDHKFLASGALFGFCMARVLTCTMRLVWSTHQTNESVAIAASIFVNAGVIIIIIINLLFAQRILRASHPKFGWARTVHWLFIAYYVVIIGLLIALITAIVQQSYTLDANTHRIDRDILLVGGTNSVFAAFLPIPLLLIGVVLPKLRTSSSNPRRVDKFGTGRFRTKIWILLFSTLLITLGAGFRAGTNYAPRPVDNPAWYHSRACFYCFNFLCEIVVLYMYAFLRVDRRFHVPNGASGRHNYGPAKGEQVTRVTSEEEFLDDFRPVEEGGLSMDEERANTVIPGSARDSESSTREKKAVVELENSQNGQNC